MTLECRVVAHIEEFGEKAWDALLADDYPFLRYAFLNTFETSKTISGKSGWYAQYIGVFRGDELIGAAPCYLKTHPYGEYVFDWSWAEAYEDAGLEYYPKVICAVPFTPASGPRLLVSQGEDDVEIRRYLMGAMHSLAEKLECSGIHILFPPKTLIEERHAGSFLERRAVQFHWFNRDYRTFDDFLNVLTSRKRKNIRKERKSIVDQGVSVEVVEGHEVTAEQLSRFYQFYERTYLKRSGHTGYLNQDFFEQLMMAIPDALILVFALVDGERVGGSLYFRSQDTLYGRYWGCLSEFENLHFELCYYQGIEYCIANQIARFDAGAQGEHKLLRGFEPAITYSLHHLRHQGFHQAIGDYLQREHGLIQGYYEDALAHLPFKQISDSQ
ncbi:GNAT family N-acetyltransferase [Grimontia sp. NTOU-MAR1]|uniref:GNAT family N-acetyltransferase n=1 Tax=Grimontia sp. NTOU-MAR1 TaxID=3111011 RepID=UPI002DBF6EA7|nr:GNAT family N-acetyltransferase [Grimontia sp. NTOU-MAR1]WRW00433.1 GNAT family N-acetyltransferase [Grimontia sp. NTOU-MAR1]